MNFEHPSGMERYTPDLSVFPDLALLNIFSYLDEKDKLNCAEVCQNWHRLVYSPIVWRKLSVTEWAYSGSIRRYTGFTDFENHSCLEYPEERGWILLNDEGYLKINGSVNDLDNKSISIPALITPIRDVIWEYKFLVGCLENLLPKIGQGVVSLRLDGSGAISDYLLNLYLMLCPNVRKLDVSYSALGNMAFNGIHTYGAARKITHLNLVGCRQITDATIENLTRCWELEQPSKSQNNPLISVPYCVKSVEEVCGEVVQCQKVSYGKNSWGYIKAENFKTFTIPKATDTVKSGLKSLNLSGCVNLSDASLEFLAKSPRIADVEFLDVSGCRRFSGEVLKKLINACPKLKPKNLFYCTLLCNGPFPDEANSCSVSVEICSCDCSFRHF